MALSEGVNSLGFVDKGGEDALLFTIRLAVDSVESGGIGGQVKVAGYYDYVAEASERFTSFATLLRKDSLLSSEVGSFLSGVDFWGA